MDPEECELLIFENVRRFYASLDLNVDEGIPILLVDRDEMIKFKDEKTETIPTGVAIFNYCTPIMTINRCTKYEDRIKVEKKANKVVKRQLLAALFCCGQREMIRLLLQFGWPDVLMGMTLAHEMMHAWLSFQGLIVGFALERWVEEVLFVGLIGGRKPERLVEEGICEVMSHMYGKWFCSRGFKYPSYNITDEQLQFTKDLNKYYANHNKTDADEAYREGFKQAMHAVKENGLKKTLDCIVKKGRLAPKMEEGEDNCEDAKRSLPPHKNDVAPPQGIQWVIVQ
ncbi:protein DA1-related 1 [Prunus persica]|uniref:protein DA1-related 1 n=1 Tax=Prunus persica TaxID=3760 RepID=UPI0009AB71FF|nr:protein DA1-related 1 [Prunus persica]